MKHAALGVLSAAAVVQCVAPASGEVRTASARISPLDNAGIGWVVLDESGEAINNSYQSLLPGDHVLQVRGNYSAASADGDSGMPGQTSAGVRLLFADPSRVVVSGAAGSLISAAFCLPDSIDRNETFTDDLDTALSITATSSDAGSFATATVFARWTGDHGSPAAFILSRAAFIDAGESSTSAAAYATVEVAVTILPPSEGEPDALAFDVVSAVREDLNLNGRVDGADLGLLLSAWGSDDLVSDLNADGVVDGADLGLLCGAWDV
ncbi:MAG: hypothetical protein ACF8QF_02620 [Phycisphaerales bacterium]